MFAILNRVSWLLTICVLTLFTNQTRAIAEILVSDQAQDLVDVVVDSDVQFDPVTQLYTYTYQVTSQSTSVQNVTRFAVEIDGEILNVQSPEGWASFPFVEEPLIMWSAVKLGALPPDFVSDGNILPSPFQIKPGETLGGFSFQSPEPAQFTRFFAQGFAKIPQAEFEDELDIPEISFPVFPLNSKEGSAVGPGLDDSLIFFGGRRPSVDGFLGFVGSTNRETRPLPVTIIVRFAINGETVDTSTFQASLNRVDVTGSFLPTGNGTELMAVFELDSSSLVTGRNVLNTSVNGIVPGTTRTASDGDSFTFFVP